MPTWHLFLDVSQTCKLNKDCKREVLIFISQSVLTLSSCKWKLYLLLFKLEFYKSLWTLLISSHSFHLSANPVSFTLKIYLEIICFFPVFICFHLVGATRIHLPGLQKLPPVGHSLFLLFSFNSILHTEAWRMRFKAQIIKLYCII